MYICIYIYMYMCALVYTHVPKVIASPLQLSRWLKINEHPSLKIKRRKPPSDNLNASSATQC